MSMFPGPHARIDRNEAGEPIGWDYPDQDDPYDPDDYLYDDALDDYDHWDDDDIDVSDTITGQGVDHWEAGL